jgi:protein gp37
MADKTRIEWTDTTWNPVTGCSPISAGCEHCYARRMATRLRGRCGYPADDPFAVTVHTDRFCDPLRWRKPRRIFVCSMGDLFHEEVPREAISNVFTMASACPRHVFQILTKRPNRMRSMVDRMMRESGGGIRRPPTNVWLGVTVENQQEADVRVPALLEIPAATRFVSVEPMLGPVNLFQVARPNYYDESPYGWRDWLPRKLHWVICGQETGPSARPCDPAWVERMSDQCVDLGIPFFAKRLPQEYSGRVCRREWPDNR